MVATAVDLTPDEARVDVVQNVLAVAMIGCTRAHAWATEIVRALDAYDNTERIEHPRGQMGWADETEPDDEETTT